MTIEKTIMNFISLEFENNDLDSTMDEAIQFIEEIAKYIVKQLEIASHANSVFNETDNVDKAISSIIGALKYRQDLKNYFPPNHKEFCTRITKNAKANNYDDPNYNDLTLEDELRFAFLWDTSILHNLRDFLWNHYR